MLRQTTASLMMRRTAVRLSGDGHIRPKLPLDQIPPADNSLGLFWNKLNGPMAILRFVDFKWMMNRCVAMEREGYMAYPALVFMTWVIFWKIPQIGFWGERTTPYVVDWNTGKAGRLPAGFEATKV